MVLMRTGFAGTYEEKIQSCINAHPVFLISKTFCPFCLELKRTYVHEHMHARTHTK